MVRLVSGVCRARWSVAVDHESQSLRLAAEALCDARVSRLTSRSASSFVDQLARMATATRGTVSSPSTWADGWGVRTHVVEMVLTVDQAVLAVIETHGSESVGRLWSFFGTELRLLTKLVAASRYAERLTERELERLRRCLGLQPTVPEPVTVVPSARWWALPWERIIPGTRFAMCASATRSHAAASARRPLSVVGIGDPSPAGSKAELDTLRALNADGRRTTGTGMFRVGVARCPSLWKAQPRRLN